MGKVSGSTQHPVFPVKVRVVNSKAHIIASACDLLRVGLSRLGEAACVRHRTTCITVRNAPGPRGERNASRGGCLEQPMIRPGLYRLLVGMLWAWPGCRVLRMHDHQSVRRRTDNGEETVAFLASLTETLSRDFVASFCRDPAERVQAFTATLL